MTHGTTSSILFQCIVMPGSSKSCVALACWLSKLWFLLSPFLLSFGNAVGSENWTSHCMQHTDEMRKFRIYCCCCFFVIFPKKILLGRKYFCVYQCKYSVIIKTEHSKYLFFTYILYMITRHRHLESPLFASQSPGVVLSTILCTANRLFYCSGYC